MSVMPASVRFKPVLRGVCTLFLTRLSPVSHSVSARFCTILGRNVTLRRLGTGVLNTRYSLGCLRFYPINTTILTILRGKVTFRRVEMEVWNGENGWRTGVQR